MFLRQLIALLFIVSLSIEASGNCLNVVTSLERKYQEIEISTEYIKQKLPYLKRYPDCFVFGIEIKIQDAMQMIGVVKAQCGQINPEFVAYAIEVESNYVAVNECLIKATDLIERHTLYQQYDASIALGVQATMVADLAALLDSVQNSQCLDELGRAHMQNIKLYWENLTVAGG